MGRKSVFERQMQHEWTKIVHARTVTMYCVAGENSGIYVFADDTDVLVLLIAKSRAVNANVYIKSDSEC